MLSVLKRKIGKTAFGKRLKKILGKETVVDTFIGSKKYWENRYVADGNSGSGSYGRLALYKAEFINNFVLENKIDKVIEFGSGDGHQLTLAKYPSYTGFDVSQKAVDLCQELFKDDHSKTFLLVTEENLKNQQAALTMSLDVIYHLIENEVYETYMNTLFSASTKYVIIYASNYDERIAPHVLSRKFTTWVANNMLNWELATHEKNPYPYDPTNPDHTSIADFYVYKKRDL
ncbi:hypothetical protein [uncultured Dokdonia sp.]|uniref:hypothetical protein n=1 Tax=uncultured Dokdonia sp. TaxID=575653 RepID=UPI002639F0CB|nr:hypothetical protein [uncultured Dokdonia sp.]